MIDIYYQLKQSHDGFAFMADCFGKGLFSQLEEEEEKQQQEQGMEEGEMNEMSGLNGEQFVQERVVDDLDEEAIPIQTLEL